MTFFQSFLLTVAIVLPLWILYAGYQAKKAARPKARQLKQDSPTDFGYKMAWIALPTNHTASVVEALRITRPQPATWQEGIAKAYQKRVFVTPPLAGWTLVAGVALFSNDEYDKWEALLSQLSQHFGEAQYFATHRVVEHHQWIRYAQGECLRHYAYLGESGAVLRAVGQPTELEQGLPTGSEDEETLALPDEELVMQMAAAWSINPTTLSSRTDIPPGPGLVGGFSI